MEKIPDEILAMEHNCITVEDAYDIRSIKKIFPQPLREYVVEINYEHEVFDVLKYHAGIYFVAVLKIPGLATIDVVYNTTCGCIYAYMPRVDEMKQEPEDDPPFQRLHRDFQRAVKYARYIYRSQFGIENE